MARGMGGGRVRGTARHALARTLGAALVINGGGYVPPVAPLLPVNTSLPAISGTAQEGQILTVSNGTWANSPGSFTYQWNRDGAPISGNTNAARTLTSSDVGHVLTCTVTATNSGGSASATSAATVSVIAATAPLPVNSVAPAVTGAATVGSLLTTDTGTWSNSPTGYAYAWRRDGVDIAGATASTYTLVSADAGKSITCRVFATNAGGTAGATSNVIAVAAAAGVSFSGPMAFTAGAPAGTLIANITGVPAGATPTLSPNDGRMAIAGDQASGWKVVVGSSFSTAGTGIVLGVNATGAAAAIGTATVNAPAASWVPLTFALQVPDLDLDYPNSRFKVGSVVYTSIADAVAAGVCVQSSFANNKQGDIWNLPTAIVNALATTSLLQWSYIGTMPDKTGLSATSPNEMRAAFALVNAAGNANESYLAGIAFNTATGSDDASGIRARFRAQQRSANAVSYSLEPLNGADILTGTDLRMTGQIKSGAHAINQWAPGAVTSTKVPTLENTNSSTHANAASGLTRLVVGNNLSGLRQWAPNGAGNSDGVGRITLWAGTPFSPVQLQTLSYLSAAPSSAPGIYTGFIRNKALRYADADNREHLLFSTCDTSGPIRIFDLDQQSGQFWRRMTASGSVNGGDDHNSAALGITPSNRLMSLVTAHGSASFQYFKRNPNVLPDVEGLHTATEVAIDWSALGEVAYSELYVTPSGSAFPNRIYAFGRTGGAISGLSSAWCWGYSYSDDDGVTWSAPAALINGGTQYYVYGQWAGPNRLRFFCNENSSTPAGSQEGIRVLEWDIQTNTVYWAGGSKALTGTGATSRVNVKLDGPGGGFIPAFQPGTGSISFSHSTSSRDGNFFVGTSLLVDNASADNGRVQNYSFVYSGSGDALDPANWTRTLIVTGGIAASDEKRFGGTATIVNRTDIANKRVFIGIHGADGIWRVKQYDAKNALGTEWAEIATVDALADTDYGVCFRPVAVANPTATSMQIVYCKGRYQNYVAGAAGWTGTASRTRWAA